MINLESKTIKHGESEQPIKKWVVMFQTPLGLCDSLEEAQTVCLANDWLPNLCIIPTPVAVGVDTYEVSTRN